MFLTNGKLVHYNADGTEEATVYTAQPNQRILMIGTSYQADVILNQSLSDAPASTAIYCEITGDAFGRIFIANKSAEQLLLVNGVHIKKERPLQTASEIQIGTHKFRWECDSAARPVTPNEMLQKSLEHVKNIHKTVSHSEPSRNIRAKKTARKIKQLANKPGRFTIYTRCPETAAGNTNNSGPSDENSMNEANSANEAEEDKEEEENEQEKSQSDAEIADSNDDLLAPDDRLMLEESRSADVSLNTSDALAETGETAVQTAEAIEVTELASDDRDETAEVSMPPESVAEVEQSDLDVIPIVACDPSKPDAVESVEEATPVEDTDSADSSEDIPKDEALETVLDEIAVIACDSPKPVAEESVEEAPVDDEPHPESVAEVEQSDVDDIPIGNHLQSEVGESIEDIPKVDAQETVEFVEEAFVAEVTYLAETDKRLQSPDQVSETVEDTPKPVAMETDVEEIPDDYETKPEAASIADVHSTDLVPAEDELNIEEIVEKKAETVVDTPATDTEDTTDHVVTPSPTEEPNDDETVVDAPAADVSTVIDTVAELAHNVEDITIAAADAETVVDNVLSTDDLTDMDLIELDESLTEHRSANDAPVKVDPMAVDVTDEPAPSPVAAPPTVLSAQPTPVRRRSLRLSTSEACEQPETPRPTLHAIAEKESQLGTETVELPPLKTPACRRSVRNSNDQSMTESGLMGTPKGKRGGAVAGLLAKVRAVDSPSLKSAATTEKLPSLTPRRRSARKSADLMGDLLRTPLVDQELKNKLKMISDSPDENEAHAIETAKTPSRRRPVRKALDLVGLDAQAATPKALTVLGAIVELPDTDAVMTPSLRRSQRKSVDHAGDLMATPKVAQPSSLLASVIEIDAAETPTRKRAPRKVNTMSGVVIGTPAKTKVKVEVIDVDAEVDFVPLEKPTSILPADLIEDSVMCQDVATANSPAKTKVQVEVIDVDAADVVVNPLEEPTSILPADPIEDSVVCQDAATPNSPAKTDVKIEEVIDVDAVAHVDAVVSMNDSILASRIDNDVVEIDQSGVADIETPSKNDVVEEASANDEPKVSDATDESEVDAVSSEDPTSNLPADVSVEEVTVVDADVIDVDKEDSEIDQSEVAIESPAKNDVAEEAPADAEPKASEINDETEVEDPGVDIEDSGVCPDSEKEVIDVDAEFDAAVSTFSTATEPQDADEAPPSAIIADGDAQADNVMTEVDAELVDEPTPISREDLIDDSGVCQDAKDTVHSTASTPNSPAKTASDAIDIKPVTTITAGEATTPADEQESSSTPALQQSPPVNAALERIAASLNITDSDLEQDLDVTMSEVGVLSAAESLSDLTDIDDMANKKPQPLRASADDGDDNGDEAAAAADDAVVATGGDDDDDDNGLLSATQSSDETSTTTLPMVQQQTADVDCESRAAETEQQPQQVMADDDTAAAGETTLVSGGIINNTITVAAADELESPRKSDPTTMATDAAAATGADDHDDNKAAVVRISCDAAVRTSSVAKEEEDVVNGVGAPVVCETLKATDDIGVEAEEPVAVSNSAAPVLDDDSDMATETTTTKPLNVTGTADAADEQRVQFSVPPAEVIEMLTKCAAIVDEGSIASSTDQEVEEDARVKSVDDEAAECVANLVETAMTTVPNETAIETSECSEHVKDVNDQIAVADVSSLLDNDDDAIVATNDNLERQSVEPTAAEGVDEPSTAEQSATPDASASPEKRSEPVLNVAATVDKESEEPEPTTAVNASTDVESPVALQLNATESLFVASSPEENADLADVVDAVQVVLPQSEPATEIQSSDVPNEAPETPEPIADIESPVVLQLNATKSLFGTLSVDVPSSPEDTTEADAKVVDAVTVVLSDTEESKPADQDKTDAEVTETVEVVSSDSETDAQFAIETAVVKSTLTEMPSTSEPDPSSDVVDVDPTEKEVVVKIEEEQDMFADDPTPNVSLVILADEESDAPIVTAPKLEPEEQSVADESKSVEPEPDTSVNSAKNVTPKETTPRKTTRRSTSKSLSTTRDIEPSPSASQPQSDLAAATTRLRRTSKRSSVGGAEDSTAINTTPAAKRQSVDKAQSSPAKPPTTSLVVPQLQLLAVDTPSTTAVRAARGRPRKNSHIADVLPATPVATLAAAVDVATPTPVRRGRPRKASTTVSEIGADRTPAVPEPEVRPARRTTRKASVVEPAAAAVQQAVRERTVSPPAKKPPPTVEVTVATAPPSPVDLVAAIAKRRGRPRRPTVDTAPAVPVIVEVGDDDDDAATTVPETIGNKRKSTDIDPVDSGEQAPKAQKTTRGGARGRKAAAVVVEQTAVKPTRRAKAAAVEARAETEADSAEEVVVKDVKATRKATTAKATTGRGKRAATPSADDEETTTETEVEPAAEVVGAAVKPTRKATSTRGKSAATPSVAALSPVQETQDAATPSPAKKTTARSKRNVTEEAPAETQPQVIDPPTAADEQQPSPKKRKVTAATTSKVTKSVSVEPDASSSTTTTTIEMLVLGSPKRATGRRRTPAAVVTTPTAEPIVTAAAAAAPKATRAKRGDKNAAAAEADPEAIEAIEETSAAEEPTVTAAPKAKAKPAVAPKVTRAKRGGKGAAAAAEADAEHIETEEAADEQPAEAPKATRAKRGGKNAAAFAATEAVEAVIVPIATTAIKETPAKEEPAPKATRAKRGGKTAAAAAVTTVEVEAIVESVATTPVTEETPAKMKPALKATRAKRGKTIATAEVAEDDEDDEATEEATVEVVEPETKRGRPKRARK